MKVKSIDFYCKILILCLSCLWFQEESLKTWLKAREVQLLLPYSRHTISVQMYTQAKLPYTKRFQKNPLFVFKFSTFCYHAQTCLLSLSHLCTPIGNYTLSFSRQILQNSAQTQPLMFFQGNMFRNIIFLHSNMSRKSHKPSFSLGYI